MRVAAPPVKGEANRELTAFLARALDVSRGAVTVLKGHTSRHKLIGISGLSQAEVLHRLGG